MNQNGQDIKIPSLYTSCLNYVCSNVELIRLNWLESGSKSIRLNHVISEDLLDRLTLINKLNDSTLSLFASPAFGGYLKKLQLRNCLISKDLLRLLLKNNNIDELSLNNVQVYQVGLTPKYTGPVNLHHHSDASQFGRPIDGHDEYLPMPSHSSFTISELIESLNSWSKTHLKSLNVARNPSLFSSILIRMGCLGQTLTRLNVSFTSFNNHSLGIICQDLPRIESLDISGTKVNDLSPLLLLQDSLRSLCMYHMRAVLTDDLVPIVCALTRLNSLDLSCDISTKIFADSNLSLFDVNYLLNELTKAALPDLKFLDISGKTAIKYDSLCEILGAYPKLKFLGLALTNANSFDIFTQSKSSSDKLKSSLHLSVSSPALNQTDMLLNFDSKNKSASKTNLWTSSSSVVSNNLIVTGESNEAQIIASLNTALASKRTYKHRPVYLQRALYELYIITRGFQSTRVDLLELIAELMQLHGKSQSVQLAATSCIFSLTKSTSNVPNHLLTQIINLILGTMLNYPNCQPLQKNCLYILLNEGMLNSGNYNKYLCVKATLECLGTTTEPNMISSSIAICSQAALNAEHKYRSHFSKLNEPKYMQRLIQVVNNALENVANDWTLQSVLDILWSLSEENTDWCCNFITMNGLNTYVTLIEVLGNELDVVKKSMKLIFNLSEIAQIRPILFCHPIANLVKKMLYHHDQNVSFLSVGFFINLLAYMPDSNWDWHAYCPSKISDFKQELENIMSNWAIMDAEDSHTFPRHSQGSLVRLLHMNDEPAAQLWSMWAIYFSFKFISSNAAANLIKQEMISVVNETNTEQKVRDFGSHILQLIQTIFLRF